MKVLLLESIHPIAKKKLEEVGLEVDLLDYSPALSDMKSLFANYDALGIRSKTKLTAEMLQESSHLLAVGCFCIGTNQVDLSIAKKHGIAVFNAPHSNTRSVAELVLAEMVMLSRQLGDRNTCAHLGKWVKSAKGANEIRGKRLGIVGYGHIGSQVSVLAEAFGLKVYFYDVTKKLPLGNAKAMSSLDNLLEKCDFITLHVPETLDTQKMLGKYELEKMKKGSYLINASRGSVVDIDELVASIKSGHIAGAALDVFPVEPASNNEDFLSPLQNVENVILTPHIGGSTEEAQYSIGVEVAESLINFLQKGITAGAVNFPHVEMTARPHTQRLINAHKNVPGVLGKINGIISSQGTNIEAQYLGTDEDVGYLVIDIKDTAASSVKTLKEEIKNLEESIITRLLL